MEIIHVPPLGCLQGDLSKSNTQVSRSQGKLWGTQYVGQGKRMCLSAHNSPRAGRGKTIKLNSRVLFIPSQAHPSPPVTRTQSNSGHCSCPSPGSYHPLLPAFSSWIPHSSGFLGPLCLRTHWTPPFCPLNLRFPTSGSCCATNIRKRKIIFLAWSKKNH